jgi:hypothetical protein
VSDPYKLTATRLLNSYVGYTSSIPGSIVGNPGFIAQFATKTINGRLQLDANHVGLWGAMKFLAQVLTQIISPITANRFGLRFNMWVLTLLKVAVSLSSRMLLSVSLMDAGNRHRNCIDIVVALPPCKHLRWDVFGLRWDLNHVVCLRDLHATNARSRARFLRFQFRDGSALRCYRSRSHCQGKRILPILPAHQ